MINPLYISLTAKEQDVQLLFLRLLLTHKKGSRSRLPLS